MYIRQAALSQSIYALYWKVVGLSPWLAVNFFHFFVTLLTADYKLTMLTNNGYNECLYEISTKSHEKRRENVIVTGICFPSSSVVEHHQPCERKVMSSSSF